MPERLFQIFSVVKPGQSDTKTKKTPNKLFTGSFSAAAKKAMTVLCKKKSIHGVCTLTITVREVKRVMQNGEMKTVAIQDSNGIQKLRKYKLKRSVNETPILFNSETPVTFKYKIEIVESFGRVLPKNL